MSHLECPQAFEGQRVEIVQDDVEQLLMGESFGQRWCTLEEIPIGRVDRLVRLRQAAVHVVQHERPVDAVDVIEFRLDRRADALVEEIIRTRIRSMDGGLLEDDLEFSQMRMFVEHVALQSAEIFDIEHQSFETRGVGREYGQGEIVQLIVADEVLSETFG